MSVISKIINNVWTSSNQIIGSVNSNGKPVVVEDPDLTKDRIWIDDQGHTSSTLQPIFASKNSLLLTQGTTVQGGIQYIASDLFNTTWTGGTGTAAMIYAPIFTNRGTISAMTDRNLISTYHKSINNIEYPARVTWKTASGNFLTVTPNQVATTYSLQGSIGGGGPGGAEHRMRGLRTADFDTAAAVYSMATSTFSTNRFADVFFYEDVANQRIYGFHEASRMGNSICHTVTTNAVSYDSHLASSRTVTNTENHTEIIQFLGVDANKNTYYARSYVALTLGTFTITKVDATGTGTTSMYTGDNAFQAAVESYAGRQPSNIRIDSSSSHVFYITARTTAGVNAGYPIRFIFNPTAGTITSSACTMASAMTLPSYPLISWAPQTGRHRGYQFTKEGTKYITFIPSRYGSATTNSTGNFAWQTYSIDATDDTILTSHSNYSNATVSVSDWMPIGEYTDRLVSIRAANKYLDFWQFNTSTGWNITGTYEVATDFVGIDNYSRVWASSTDPTREAYSLVHLITPTLPLNFSITTPGTTFNYTGSNVSSNVTINAYNYLGSRIATPVTLTINGNNIVFTSSGTTSLTVNTSASADVTVPITIYGPGFGSVSAQASL